MTDISLTQFAEANTDRVTGDDLIGGPRTIKITKVEGAVEEGKKRAIIHYEGEEPGKPFKPCKTMVRAMMAVWGEYASTFVGKSLTIYRDPAVTFGALATGGVRISHMSDMEEPVTIILAAKKGKKSPITIKPLVIAATVAKPDPRDGAQTWADEHIAKINACNDKDDIIALNNKAARAMERMQANFPDIFQAISDATNIRMSDFEGVNDDA